MAGSLPHGCPTAPHLQLRRSARALSRNGDTRPLQHGPTESVNGCRLRAGALVALSAQAAPGPVLQSVPDLSACDAQRGTRSAPPLTSGPASGVATEGSLVPQLLGESSNSHGSAAFDAATCIAQVRVCSNRQQVAGRWVQDCQGIGRGLHARIGMLLNRLTIVVWHHAYISSRLRAL